MNTTPTIYYKVVAPHWVTKHLISARCGGLVYSTTEFTYPNIPNSKIFVFNNFYNAMRFAESEDQIWECEVINPQPAKYYAPRMRDTLEDFWAMSEEARLALYNEIISGKYREDYMMPPGTIFADAVKLTKQIK